MAQLASPLASISDAIMGSMKTLMIFPGGVRHFLDVHAAFAERIEHTLFGLRGRSRSDR